MKTTFFSVSKSLTLFTIVFLALLANFALGQWTGPSATPPGSNVAAPVNVGSTNQVKNAGLMLTNSLGVAGPTSHLLMVQDGGGVPGIYRFLLGADNILRLQSGPNTFTMTEIAQFNPTFARFANQVRAAEYCDLDGLNCTTAPEIRNTVTSFSSVTPPGASCPAGRLAVHDHCGPNVPAGFHGQIHSEYGPSGHTTSQCRNGTWEIVPGQWNTSCTVGR